jgi:hypothetical protein
MTPQSGDDGGSFRRAGANPTDPGTARIISALMYASIVVYMYIGSAVKTPLATGLPEFLPWLILGVAIVDYAASLLLESQLLGERRLRTVATQQSGGSISAAVIVPAIVVSAFGVSIAVYGLVLGLIGFWPWPWYFYGLAALHGIHLQLRWDRYEEAARRAAS